MSADQIVALATPLTVVLAFILQWRKTRRHKDDLDEKLEVIRIDVNSNLQKALSEIETLKVYIEKDLKRPLPDEVLP